MKSKLAAIFLILLCVGLGVGLIVRHQQATRAQELALAHILQLSNDVVETRSNLEKKQGDNLLMDKDLTARKSDLLSVSNNLAAVSASLARLQVEAKAAAETAAAELARRDAKIIELQGQNDDMTKKMGDLSLSLTNLETQIADTQRKLATSEGDREFLVQELRRLQAEKAELERQFNDLVILREQVRKLKDELSISRRLEWLKQGIYGNLGKKGGERLTEAAKSSSPKTNIPSLNVELRQDGGVKVEASPGAAETNAPVKTQ